MFHVLIFIIDGLHTGKKKTDKINLTSSRPEIIIGQVQVLIPLQLEQTFWDLYHQSLEYIRYRKQHTEFTIKKKKKKRFSIIWKKKRKK